MKLIAIDPGIRVCGYAVFKNRKLDFAWFTKVPRTCNFVEAAKLHAEQLSLVLPLDVIVVEMPRVYPELRSKGDPNYLMQIAVIVGSIIERLRNPAHVVAYEPKQWKGTLDKQVHHGRLREKYPEDCKQANLAPLPLQEHLYDAIGLGRYWLERS